MAPSTYPVLSSRPIQPHVPAKCARCNAEFEFLVPDPVPPPGTLLQVRCFQCQDISTQSYQDKSSIRLNAKPSSSSSGTSTPQEKQRRTRKIGTQEKPLETEYYETLGIAIDATDDDIKKAYRSFLSHFVSRECQCSLTNR